MANPRRSDWGFVCARCYFLGQRSLEVFSYKHNRPVKDPHHAHLAEHYKQTPWWWYVIILVFSFVLGLVVVIKENLMLPPWAYVVALILGIIVSFFVGIWKRSH